nr:type I restriction enzyme HsdR N-terminal domain-containing protein [Bacteroidota bacterium]
MQHLNLPQYEFRIRQSDNGNEIFDEIRKKYVALTPEEWVRQNFLKYLISEKGTPLSLIAVEKSLKLYGMVKRSDIVVFNRNGEALLLVECKAHTVKIAQKVFDQAAMYNIKFNVEYLFVTNGMEHYGCKIDFKNRTYRFLDHIPDYIEMKG